MREVEVLELLGVSRTTLRRWVDAGKFVRPYPLGPRCIRFKESEILSWCEARKPGACAPVRPKKAKPSAVGSSGGLNQVCNDGDNDQQQDHSTTAESG